MIRMRRLARRLGNERGWSLMEVMVTASMLSLVLGAALAPFEVLQRTDRVTQNQSDSQDNARNTVDSLAHQLRNVMGQSQLIDRANPYDLIFETVDPRFKPEGSDNARNLMRVRFCLDTSNAPADASHGRLWEQDLTWTSATDPATLPGLACPDVNFGTRRVLADAITNKISGQDRPLFSYSPGTSPLASITSIRIDLFTDRNPNEAPRETELTSGVFLRNQNGPPTASATVTATGQPASGHAQRIRVERPGEPPADVSLVRPLDQLDVRRDDERGEGQLFTYTLPGASGARNMVLEVFDAGGLESDYTFTANAS